MKSTRREFGLAAAAFVAAPGLVACDRPPAPVISSRVLGTTGTPTTVAPVTPVFPLRRRHGDRYLTDTAGVPFFLHADTPWSIAVQLTRLQIDEYLDDRRRRGFNTVFFNAIEHYFSSNRPYYRNAEGHDPFIPMSRFAAPNPAYWDLVDHLVAASERRGIACLIAPAYLGYGGGAGSPDDQGWNAEVDSTSDVDLQTYGRFLAHRYGGRNVVWVLGGDYDPPNPAKQWNIARGILAVEPDALITGHGGRGTESYSVWHEQPGWNLNNIYVGTDGIAHSAAESAFGRPGPMPFFLIEGAYGNKQSDAACRLQLYQSILGGACGHCFGTFPLWGFGEPHANGGAGPTAALASSLATPATEQMTHAMRFFNAFAWWTLEPANAGQLIRRNRLSGARNISGAFAVDRRLAMIWTAGDNFAVDLSALSGPMIRALWYDTLAGRFRLVENSPMTNLGTLELAAPGEGVLVLQAISSDT